MKNNETFSFANYARILNLINMCVGWATEDDKQLPYNLHVQLSSTRSDATSEKTFFTNKHK